MQELLKQILSEVRSAWRFRWFAVAAAWGVGIVGLGIAVALPNVYEASARVYVDGTSVLRPLLNDQIVAPNIGTHLAYVRQALLGRQHLERVAAETGLDASVTTTDGRERLLEKLQTDVVIDAVSANPNDPASLNTIFTIRYRNTRTETAVAVVRTMMTSLIELTQAANRAGTDTATKFLDDRIAELAARLDKSEQALAEFQRANSGKLPGSEGTYFERMQRERDELEKTRRDLRLANSKRDRLQQQLTSESPLALDDPALKQEPRPNSIDARIRDGRAELDRLLLMYTEKHPAVIAQKESVERLEAQRADQLRALGLSNVDQELSALGANPVYQAVQIEMNKVDIEIASLEADAKDRENRLEELQALIDEVPLVEAEQARLNRDYNVVKAQYEALIQSRERQQLSEQASASDQVEFNVLNPPRAEIEPVAPKRLLILAAVLVVALGAGGGLSYVLSQWRPVFSSAQALRDLTGLPVLGSVSRVHLDPHAEKQRRFALVSFSAAVAALVVVIGSAALYELVGPGIHSLVGGS
jgi:polysaccharide chain length determinant protein (PEP-CTERM system associated)